VTWVWNTGRCGSTLVHRALAAAGQASAKVGGPLLVSLSEPRWFDELSQRPPQSLKVIGALASSTSNAAVEATDVDEAVVFRAAHALEFAQARIRHTHQVPSSSSGGDSTTTVVASPVLLFSINTKAFGIRALRTAARAFPAQEQRHMFVYRAASEVVDSFGSIFFPQTSWTRARRAIISVSLLCPRPFPPPASSFFLHFHRPPPFLPPVFNNLKKSIKIFLLSFLDSLGDSFF